MGDRIRKYCGKRKCWFFFPNSVFYPFQSPIIKFLACHKFLSSGINFKIYVACFLLLFQLLFNKCYVCFFQYGIKLYKNPLNYFLSNQVYYFLYILYMCEWCSSKGFYETLYHTMMTFDTT